MSQAALATRMTWDRSLLARIESGRNTPSVDNLLELEEVFMVERRIDAHGDLMFLVAEVAHEAKRRGLRPVYGNTEKPEDGQEPVEIATLDRIVARIVDDWLEKMKVDPHEDRRKRD